MEPQILVGIMLQFLLYEYYDKYKGIISLLEIFIHPTLNYLYDIKTQDAFFPESPERLMGSLNKLSNLQEQCELMSKEIGRAHV